MQARVSGLMVVLIAWMLQACSEQAPPNRLLVVHGDTTTYPAGTAPFFKSFDRIDSLSIPAFSEDSLQHTAVLLFSNTSFNSLSYRQLVDMERFVKAGGSLLLFQTDTTRKEGWPGWSKWTASHPKWQKMSGTTWGRGKVFWLQNFNEWPEGILPERALNYDNINTSRVPSAERFTKVVLDDDLNEPMEMDIADDGRVIYIERNGKMKLYLPEKETSRTLAMFNVRTTGNYEDGMLGIAFDPDHMRNGWVYLYYSLPDTSIQRLSRFLLAYDTLIRSTETVILDVPVQTQTCCHSGGSIQFGPDGLLYLSTGDNTSSKESDGYSPLDEREGRGPFDAQKSSGNTHDLRGKILRIKPLPEGGYAIPEGNLFPPDGSNGRPEIFVMGARNPFRISVDAKTGAVMWGDVGPDSGIDGEQGPQSYDEFNRTRIPGNFGWPYFVGDNKAYPDWDFVTYTYAGPPQDPLHPQNRSPHNTGDSLLPPAQLPRIWYPYGESEIWPVLGKGSRSAMSGPVYYQELYHGSRRFPEYYNGKWFLYEWARSWIMVAHLNENDEVTFIEPFFSEMDLSKPIDLEFGPDGALYLLEYGANYFSNNDEARLSRIDYAAGNRPPVARPSVYPKAGSIPLEVRLSGSQSFDYDKDDKLQYAWYDAAGQLIGNGDSIRHTIQTGGVHEITLVVTDQHGARHRDVIEIEAGNDPPQIIFKTKGNQAFYFSGSDLPYEVSIKDKEDGNSALGTIEPSQVGLAFRYVPGSHNLAALPPGEKEKLFAMRGKQLINDSDCKSCHHMTESSIGPSYQAIANRYDPQPSVVNMLAEKIIIGGSGNWGHALMAAHPQHSLNETREMVQYILSLDPTQASGSLPLQGKLKFDQHNREEAGTYILRIRYTDRGYEEAPPITSEEYFTFRSTRVEAEEYTDYYRAARNRPRGGPLTFVQVQSPQSWIKFENLDFTHIERIRMRARIFKNAHLHITYGSLEGPVVVDELMDASGDSYELIDLPIKKQAGPGDYYLIFEDDDNRGRTGHIDWLTFIPERQKSGH